jgi:ribonuclease HI
MEKQTDLFGTPIALVKKPATKAVLDDLHIFMDGASRGNPGPAGAGIFMFQGQKNILAEGLYLGKKTNNQAEYLALLLAVLFVEKLIAEKKVAFTRIRFFSDSELMIKQMNGIYKVKNEQLQALHGIITTRLKKYVCSFTHVLRGKNADADALANLGVDHKKKVPTSFQKILADYGIHV